MELNYQTGFANHHSTEALPGALPLEQNSPQRAPLGLYAEQLSGTSFSAPRHENLHSWLYRILPAVVHSPFRALVHPGLSAEDHRRAPAPTQMRWGAVPYPAEPTDFVEGLHLWAIGGGAAEQRGCGVYLYAATRSMDSTYFYSADGEWLIVPQEGSLRIHTELGALAVAPGSIAVVPRGIRYQVHLGDARARGYVCENFGAPLRLPHLGPIGSNGLADPRHFEAPVARFEERRGDFSLIAKFQGALWKAELGHSPLDVVAWHGNYFPYRYDLSRFNTIGTVSFDHPDPSIFTVLTSPSDTVGVANVDFVIFPPRWMVAEHTFRPPYFHRNFMSEIMGLVHGMYDAKAKGFVPGGMSLHNSMSGHGPDSTTYDRASQADLKPHYIKDTLAFMFESRYAFAPTDRALVSEVFDADYAAVWKDLESKFKR